MEIKNFKVERGIMILEPGNIKPEAYNTIMSNIKKGTLLTDISLKDGKIHITLEDVKEQP